MKKVLRRSIALLFVVILFTTEPNNVYAASTAVCTVNDITSTGMYKCYKFTPSAYALNSVSVLTLYDTTSATPMYWHVPAGQSFTFYAFLQSRNTFRVSVYESNSLVSYIKANNRIYCKFTAPVLDEDKDYHVIITGTSSTIYISSYNARWGN
ncbi:hypothetical protein [Anaeromicropila populeti]|uniref:Secreted protein n=1 Tax=Anaeromicropila populeti TaxID=37658 RepID=A0A1I6I6B6_9FIRM|nr:hypothetical protein [Anaeromicropila populeti]SFR62272.1 hypothetical protein SAMN05661086_00469 [Anaeromicropila populeti]